MKSTDIMKQVREIDIIVKRSVSEIFVGNYKSSFRGTGLEVEDIRKYSEGDDARMIDWITTAKQGTTYVKKYQETRELGVVIALDLSASMNFSTTDKRKRDVAIHTASCLIYSAMNNNDKFGLLLFSDTVEKYIPHGKGKGQFIRIIREIVRGFEKNDYKKSSHKTVLNFINSAIGRNQLIFYISDGMSEDAFSSLKIASKKHDFIFINIFDKFERGQVGRDMIFVEDLETGKKHIANLTNKKTFANFRKIRQQKLNSLRNLLKKSRIDTVDISTDGNIYKELLMFFKKRQLKK